MEDDVGVRKFLELIFVKKFQITPEMTAPDSPFPVCLLINDFSLKLRRVFCARQMIVKLKWSERIETCTWHMSTTYEAYLNNVIFGCYNEHYCHQDIFESFISVCSFVKYFSEETFRKKGGNFSDINCDIIMEFYESVLKNTFLRCGGFQRLVEYIHHHKYLAWNLDMDDLADPSTPPSVKIDKKLKKMANREHNVLKFITPEKIIKMLSADTMAQKILLNVSVKLSTLPNDHDSNRKASGSNDKLKTAEGKRLFEADLKFDPLEEVIQGCSNSNSETDRVVKRTEDFARYESIIQAVMRHNQSRNSGVTSDNSLQKKADGILKHLKDAIESLINVLDEYDKE